MTNTIDIALLGAPGTGKSSLIASMWSEFAGGIDGPPVKGKDRLALSLLDDESASYLQDQRARLNRLARQIRVREPGLIGDATSRTYELSLHEVQKVEETHLNVRFTDYPGGWLFGSRYSAIGAADRDELKNRLKNSATLIIAIDTPAMMWNGGEHHEEVNRPMEVRKHVETWLQGNAHRSVVFVPIKCEAWVSDGNSIDDLDRITRDRYEEVYAVLRGHDDIRVVFSPVQTVGSIRHTGYINEPDGTFTSVFGGVKANGRYQPRWTVEPLRFALQDAITSHVDGMNAWDKIICWFWKVDQQLAGALDALATNVGASNRVWQHGRNPVPAASGANS